MELLLLVIPFEDTGAMETFLLNAIANDSAYDAEIIRKGNQFVEEVDKERKYLTKRRYITKPQIPVPNGPGDSEIFEFLKFFLNL